MKRYSLVIGIIAVLFIFGFVQFYGCGDDDDDATMPATFTPGEETATPTATPTVTATPETRIGMGILNIWTLPVAGDIYVDGQWVGWSVWQGE